MKLWMNRGSNLFDVSTNNTLTNFCCGWLIVHFNWLFLCPCDQNMIIWSDQKSFSFHWSLGPCDLSYHHFLTYDASLVIQLILICVYQLYSEQIIMLWLWLVMCQGQAYWEGRSRERVESGRGKARNLQGNRAVYPSESRRWLPVARDIDSDCDHRKSACLVQNILRVATRVASVE